MEVKIEGKMNVGLLFVINKINTFAHTRTTLEDVYADMKDILDEILDKGLNAGFTGTHIWVTREDTGNRIMSITNN